MLRIADRSLTTWSLAGLFAGVALGTVGHSVSGPVFATLAAVLGPVGAFWAAALQMTALPLVIAYTLAAVAGASGGKSLGTLGVRAVMLFVALLVLAALFTLVVAPPLVRLYHVDPAAVSLLSRSTVIPDAALQANGATGAAAGGSVGDWVAALVPRNVFLSASQGEILPLLIFTIMFAVAVRTLPEAQRDPLVRTFNAGAAALLQCVRWILIAGPLGILGLAFTLAYGAGLQSAGILGAFVVIICLVMLAFTGLLYPLSAVAGGVRLRDFARAAAPAQLVAVSTRSSIASLPALVEGATAHLDLPESATGFVLPLSVSLFKVNRTISAPVKLFFVAHVFGIPLSSGTIVTFVLTVILLSFSTIGVPGGGSSFKTLPAYLAAGLPLEGIVIMEAVDLIPDIFKTLLNVTGDMSAVTILSRRPVSARATGVAPERRPAAGTAA